MNTVRVTITAPPDLIKELKSHTNNLSKFLIDAAVEKMEHDRKLNAMKWFEKHGPLLPEITNSVDYINTLRSKHDTEWEERVNNRPNNTFSKDSK